uniref:Ig-like domain-containing protein n=1 Tax=Pygocentrus nattereri TaxID=42514 RepID=A0A3B4CBU7_PYGNA
MKLYFFTESCVSQSIAPLDNKVLVHAREDETVTLSCTYKSSGNVEYLHWYRQYLGSRPEYLLMILPGSNIVNYATPPFTRLNTTENHKTVNLIISSAEVSDSALYYCAMKSTVTGNPATLHKNSLQDDALNFSDETCFRLLNYLDLNSNIILLWYLVLVLAQGRIIRDMGRSFYTHICLN